MAGATSGNALELLHTKAAPRWGWVTLCIVGASVFGAGSGNVSGIHAVLAVALAVLFFVGASLPLLSETPRSFVHAFRWWWFLFFLGVSIQIFCNSADSGNFLSLFVWPPLFIVSFLQLRFRPQRFLVVFFGVGFLGFVIQKLFECISDTERTFGECVEKWSQLQTSWADADLYVFAGVVLVLLGRKFVNDFLARRAAKASRDRHRHASLQPKS